jgi:hypothetical protein
MRRRQQAALPPLPTSYDRFYYSIYECVPKFNIIRQISQWIDVSMTFYVNMKILRIVRKATHKHRVFTES